MSLKTFQVVFDRASATYVVGETVTGKIILDVSHAKSVKGMYATVKGEGRILWVSSHKNSLIPVNTSSETYLDLKFDIIRSQPFESRAEITSGYHEYRFSYQLPYHMPGSYKDKISNITYTMKVVIDRPWKFNHEHKSTFTVICPLNLDEHSTQCVAVDDEDRVNFYGFCCFCRQGSLDLNIKIPTSGYIPGQSIYATIKYDNLSRSVEMTKITADLKQEIIYHAKFPDGQKKRIASLIESTNLFGPFPKQGQLVLDLLIPPIPPSKLQHCHIIELAYKLCITVHVSKPHMRIEKSYPILIGTSTDQAAVAVPTQMPSSVETDMPMSTVAEMATPPCLPPHDYAQTLIHESSNTQRRFSSNFMQCIDE